MTFLLSWYQKAMQLSTHPKAAYYLGFLAFLDASLFPISPLVMLIPMSFAAPKRSFYFGGIAALTSFMGGIVGYGLGYYCFEAFLGELIQWLGYAAAYQKAMDWFNVWGFWAVLLGCVIPLPYKVFTIAAGVMQLHFGIFLMASMVGRTLRFLVIASVIYWSGPSVEPWIRRILEKMSGVNK